MKLTAVRASPSCGCDLPTRAFVLLLWTACATSNAPPRGPASAGANAKQPSSTIELCEAAGTAPPVEHLRRCAALFTGPACRAHVLSIDGGHLRADALCEACQADYCPRFTRLVPFCDGRRDEFPAHELKLEFLSAVFEVDHGSNASAAQKAFFLAAERVVNEDIAHEREATRRRREGARLALALSGDRSRLDVILLRPAVGMPYSGDPDALLPRQCRSIVAEALDGGSLRPGELALIRGERAVPFKAVRCFVDAAHEAGAGPGEIELEVFPEAVPAP